jgi:hypothetical protein
LLVLEELANIFPTAKNFNICCKVNRKNNLLKNTLILKVQGRLSKNNK